MGIKVLSKLYHTSKNRIPDMPNKQLSHRMLHGGSDLQYAVINDKQNILCN